MKVDCDCCSENDCALSLHMTIIRCAVKSMCRHVVTSIAAPAYVRYYVVAKPGKPDRPHIKTATKKSVTLSWQPPADDGGADITNYVVEYRKKGMYMHERTVF